MADEGTGPAAEETAAAAPVRPPLPEGETPQLRLADHPRAKIALSRCKAWGGLIGFVLVGALALRTDLAAFDVWWRALAGGIVGWLVGWAIGLLIWRPIVRAEAQANAAAFADRYTAAMDEHQSRIAAIQRAMDEAKAVQDERFEDLGESGRGA